MKVIGIDPGTTATGYSVIEADRCLDIGTIRPKKKSLHERIFEICQAVKKIIALSNPDYAALEKAFYHKNIQSLIKASELRGAIILALQESNINILEYTATEIKLTTTGNGRASKEQVRYFTERMFARGNARVSNHAIDAIAIAYTATRKQRVRQ
ncbi:crossover junction endodeoxyribonuclease RuvC [candidate division WOR-3 bacterium RBG_13_43_14]|uniref:Crossover junction endodeoxyribonuclease RuvC n=1 Tax=candidate division WOR-3 bacterium RBG_13_43_14 TaxID=1802590 RepID=A0A1F4UDY3_UNCW3|nr:MAG: crossover junction endodeoxyribonuclease RuvC [candidate division WOR-3 bacterium RBG_13_43_14]